MNNLSSPMSDSLVQHLKIIIINAIHYGNREKNYEIISTCHKAFINFSIYL